VTGKLDFDVGIVQQGELINTAADPAIHNIATPHQSPPRFLHIRRGGRNCLNTENVSRVFDIDLQRLRHSQANAAQHEGACVIADSNFVVVQEDCGLELVSELSVSDS
jgi:hypothetical protein